MFTKILQVTLLTAVMGNGALKAVPIESFAASYSKLLAHQAAVEAGARLNFDELRQKYFNQLDQTERQIFQGLALPPELMRGLASCARFEQVPCQHPDVLKFKSSEARVIATAESMILLERSHGRKYFGGFTLHPLPAGALEPLQNLGQRILNPDELNVISIKAHAREIKSHDMATQAMMALSPSIVANYTSQSSYFTVRKTSALWAQKVVLHEFGHLKFNDTFISDLLVELKAPTDFQKRYHALSEKRADIYGTFMSDYPLATALLNLHMPHSGHPYVHRYSKKWQELVVELAQCDKIDLPVSKKDLEKIELDLKIA